MVYCRSVQTGLPIIIIIIIIIDIDIDSLLIILCTNDKILPYFCVNLFADDKHVFARSSTIINHTWGKVRSVCFNNISAETQTAG